MKLSGRIKIEDRKLGRERNDGQAIFADKLIEIDPRSHLEGINFIIIIVNFN